MATLTLTDSALLRLLQLASPALPVGAFAFSQGMEYAMDARWLCSVDDVQQWLELQMQHALAEVDLVLLKRAMEAWQDGDLAEAGYWNAMVLACRETAELRAAELATGEALARLLPALGCGIPAGIEAPTYVAGFALAADHWQLGFAAAAHVYAWSWLENQVAAATKLLPMGQTAAQQLLSRLQTALPACVDAASCNEEEEPGAGLPGLAIASCLHETQYSRLFRS